MNVPMTPLAMLLQVAPPTNMLDRLTLVNMLTAGALLLFVWLLIRLIERFLDLLSSRASRARFFFKRLGPVIRITLWLVTALAIVNIFSETIRLRSSPASRPSGSRSDWARKT